MRVKVDFLDDPKSSAALSLGDLTFIIEEPRSSFFTPACKHKDSSSSVCWERWKHIQCFHFVYASPRQAALYSRLDVPHYSESAVKMKSAIAEFVQAHPGLDCLSHHHLPHENSITPFLLVFNCLPPAVETIYSTIDWECIARTPYSQFEQAAKESFVSTSGPPRQFLFSDFGHTSGLNQSRDDDPSGMPRPAVLNGTSNHARLFVQVTALAILLAPSLGIPSDSVYVDPDYPERHHEFQEVIHPDNRVEAIRMAIISSMLTCGCHRDNNNCSTIPGMMLVLVLSRFVAINDVPCRSSVITYSRKIITSYGRKTTTPFYECLNDLITYYQLSSNLSRRFIGHDLFIKPTAPWKPSQTQSEIDFGMFLTPCHFHLHHYLSCFIHFLKELQNHLGLGYVEMACLVYCANLKETPLFFVETARDVLSLKPSDEKLRTWGRGIGFGYGFYLSICQRRFFLKSKYSEQGFDFKSPGSRYQYSASTAVLGYSSFRSHVISIVGCCLEVWQSDPTRPTHRAKRQSCFADLRDFLQSNLDGFGYLKVQHLIMVASPIGLLPLWVSSMASLEYNGRTFTKLCAAYGVAKTDINVSFARKYLTAASSAIGESFSVTENCICKFARDTVKMIDKKMVKGQSASKSNFSDTVFNEQCFYFPDKNGSCLRIFMSDGKSSTLTGALFERWIVSHDCPNHFVSTTQVHKYVPVGKSITHIPLKFELARSLSRGNPLPNLSRYKQRNIDYLFLRSPVVSVSKWNVLRGQGATSLKEIDCDANNVGEDDGGNEDEGIAKEDAAEMSDSPRNNLVPIDDGFIRVAVLRKTVGLGEDLEVQALSKKSPAFSEDGSLNWLDRNRKRDGSFSLSLSDDESECDSNYGSDFLTLPACTFPSGGISKKRTASLHRSGCQKSSKRNDTFSLGCFPHVTRSEVQGGYLPPSFPARSWWLHRVEHKQYYRLDSRNLIIEMLPSISFRISDYLPWSKNRLSYVFIEEDPGLTLNLMILPPTLPGLTVLPGHSFPIFHTKANALFYGRLTILLTVLHSSFFSTVIRVSQKNGMSLRPTPSPTYILLTSRNRLPFGFLYVQENNVMFGFLDTNFSIVKDSIIKYS